MIPVVLSAAGVDEEKPVNQVTREERAAIGHALKALKLHVSGYRPVEEAVVTRGRLRKGDQPLDDGIKAC